MNAKASFKRAMIGAASLLCGVCGSLTAQPLADSVDRAIAHVPPLRVDRPDWQSLDAAQIVATFSGYGLNVDEDYEPYPGVRIKARFRGGCPPSEAFERNGHWKKTMCARARRFYSGSWSTEKFRGGGERICVEAPDYPRLCRSVWPLSDQRVIMAGEVYGESQDDPSAYNLYRLTVLKNETAPRR
jgi:hypothetical protein